MSDNRFVSKIGKVENTEEKLYTFLSDFRNFKELLPPDKVRNYEATEDTCSFELEMLGETGLKMIEKEPHKLIKISSDENDNKEFFLWIQLKQVEEKDTRVKVTLEVDLPPMMKMMAAGPLQEFVDTMVDQIVKLDYV